MKQRLIFLILTCAAFLTPSCAYMQSNKNVRESFCHYEGYKIESPLAVYSGQGKWYLEADKVMLKKEYPLIYDRILLDYDNDPVFKEMTNVPHGTQKCYHEISSGTAKVLMRNDGYATLEALVDEMKTSGKTWQYGYDLKLKKYPVRAMIVVKKDKVVMVPGKMIPHELPTSASVLGGITKVVVDGPGTLVYNVAIPFMAPFVFFHEFLNAE